MNTIVDQLRISYDAMPYTGGALRLTHPDNLSAVAAVSGLTSAPVASCRVLEIGCGEGRNLLPMAVTLPGSRFVGIDLSARQIDSGRATAAALSLTNIDLRVQDLSKFPAGEGAFDYIIAHGVYSWVPPEVRDATMSLLQRHLAPQGVAYVSYNTYPGWHLRRVTRDLMLFHARRASDPAQRLALGREILELAAQAPQGYSNYRDVVARARADLADASDWYLFHEFLERVNHPVYFEQFVHHAAAHRLLHLGDARPSTFAWQWLPPVLRERVMEFAKTDIEREQYLDFLSGRAFRASLLCRPDAVRSTPGVVALPKLFVAGAMIEETTEDGSIFVAGDRRLTIPSTEAEVVAAYRTIAAAWPRAVPCSALLGNAHDERLARRLIDGYLAELLELWTRPTDFISAGSERPQATALARRQALAGGDEHVVNLRHENLPIDPPLHFILPLLDGTRDKPDLLGELQRLIHTGDVVTTRENVAVAATDDLSSHLDWLLARFAERSLLVQ